MTWAHGAAGQRPSVLRGVLSDLSLPQVAGTALAAVTSMLLSSYIGIAGSIIGVAVASVVSTVCSSLYKNFLAASAERIRELPQTVHGAPAGVAEGAGASGLSVREGAGAPGQGVGAVADPAGAVPADVEGTDPADAAIPLATGAANAGGGQAGWAPGAGDQAGRSDAPETAAEPAVAGTAPGAWADDGRGALGAMLPLGAAERLRGRSTATPHLGDAGMEVDGAVRAAREARLRRSRTRRNVALVAALSALVAVALSGGAVWFLTMGQGLGAKPEPVRFSAPAKEQAADEKAKDDQKDAAADTAAADNKAASSSDAGAGADGSGADQSDASGDQGASGNGSSTGTSTGGADPGSGGSGAGSDGVGSGAGTGGSDTTSGLGGGSGSGGSADGGSGAGNSASGSGQATGAQGGSAAKAAAAGASS